MGWLHSHKLRAHPLDNFPNQCMYTKCMGEIQQVQWSDEEPTKVRLVIEK